MKKAEKDKLEKTLASYFREIQKIYVASGFRKASQRKCGNIELEPIK